jgi:hypothetical protein
MVLREDDVDRETIEYCQNPIYYINIHRSYGGGSSHSINIINTKTIINSTVNVTYASICKDFNIKDTESLSYYLCTSEVDVDGNVVEWYQSDELYLYSSIRLVNDMGIKAITANNCYGCALSLSTHIEQEASISLNITVNGPPYGSINVTWPVCSTAAYIDTLCDVSVVMVDCLNINNCTIDIDNNIKNLANMSNNTLINGGYDVASGSRMKASVLSNIDIKGVIGAEIQESDNVVVNINNNISTSGSAHSNCDELSYDILTKVDEYIKYSKYDNSEDIQSQEKHIEYTPCWD